MRKVDNIPSRHDVSSPATVADDSPFFARREVLAGSFIAGCSLIAATPAFAASTSDIPVPAGSPIQRDLPFDDGWKFWRGVLSGAEAVAFDDRSWRNIDLPHDWSIEDLPDGDSVDGGRATATADTWTDLANVPARIGPFDMKAEGGRSTGYQVGGEGWYRKNFMLPPSGGTDRIEIRFDGIFQNADVWINGEPLAFHPYGYTPFTVDITPHLRAGAANVLAVRVRNIGKTSRWASGSGITRHVWLTRTPALRIAQWGVCVTTPVVSIAEAKVVVEVAVANSGIAAAGEVRATLRDSRGGRLAPQRQEIHVGEGGEANVRLEFAVRNPALWTLERPEMYAADVELVVPGQPVDGMSTNFGIRTISATGATGLLLNGKSVKMRGVNLHQDLGPLGGVSIASAEMRRVRILKDAGFNAIRTSHQPPSPSFLDACDQIGMVVIDEIFDMWDGEKAEDDYHQYFTEWWERDLSITIRRDRNHPCIVFWSIGNEVAHPSRLPNATFMPRFNGSESWGKVMARRIRTLDSTRFVVQGGALGMATLFSLSQDSPQWDYFDVGDGHYMKDYSKFHLAHPDKAMMQSESWAAAIYQDWDRVMRNDYMIGDFIWAGWDYLGEVGVGAPQLFDVGTPVKTEDGPPSSNTYPWIAANCGDFDLIGQPKPQYFYRKVVWGDSPLEIAVERPAPAGKEQRRFMWSFYDELQSWTWDIAPGTPMKVRVYTGGDEVRLILNGRLVGTTTMSPADERIATFSIPYEPGSISAVALRNGKEIGRRTLETVGPPAALRLTPDVKRLAAAPGSLVHALVEVVDAHGRAVPDAVVLVNLEMSGGATLAGVGNGNPRNVHSFQQPRIYTFRGKALAILRSDGGDTVSRVIARAEGIKPALLQL